MTRLCKIIPVAVKDLCVAAFTAYRINNGVVKNPEIRDLKTNTITKCVTNKQIIAQVIEGVIQPSKEDRELADTAVSTLLTYNTLCILKGETTTKSDFKESILNLIQKDVDNIYSAGVIAFLPDVYYKHVAYEQKRMEIADIGCLSDYIGAVGQTVVLELTVLNSKWLPSYNIWSVIARNDNGNLISYLTSKEDCTTSGVYSGKIKNHEISRYHNNSRVTSLNYVKRV